MPGASVKVGPVRVGSGCCVALVVPVVVVALLVWASIALAATPSIKNARRATFNEINNNEGSGRGIARYEEDEIHCNRLTNSRYHCIFKFLSQLDVDLGCSAGDRGYSYVTFHRFGTEVNLHMDENVCVERRR
jgi:hypothetical protein